MHVTLANVTSDFLFTNQILWHHLIYSILGFSLHHVIWHEVLSNVELFLKPSELTHSIQLFQRGYSLWFFCCTHFRPLRKRTHWRLGSRWLLRGNGGFDWLIISMPSPFSLMLLDRKPWELFPPSHMLLSRRETREVKWLMFQKWKSSYYQKVIIFPLGICNAMLKCVKTNKRRNCLHGAGAS